MTGYTEARSHMLKSSKSFQKIYPRGKEGSQEPRGEQAKHFRAMRRVPDRVDNCKILKLVK